MDRAYSQLTVKAVREDERVITGTATTPTPDRMGDIVEPLGVRFKNPLPLLHQHRSDQPVGTVRFDKPTKDGITFEARLPKIEEPGSLKDRVDTAWGEVKAGLVRAVSIGFRPIEYSYIDSGGIRFVATEVIELSLVTVPAQAEATIDTIKSIDTALRAASGREQPGATTPRAGGSTDRARGAVSIKTEKRSAPAMDIAEQIASFETARAQKAARMDEIMEASAKAGTTLDAAEADEYDTLNTELKAVDEHIERFKALQARKAASAKAVDPRPGLRVANDNREPGVANDNRPWAQVRAAKKLPPGIEVARIARVKALAKLDGESPREMAKQLYGEDSSTYEFVAKAGAVAAGTSANSTWAGALISDESGPLGDFVEYLRPQTILGRFGAGGIPGLRPLPFRVRSVSQSSGGSGYWVGEGNPKPLTKFDFAATTLDPLKVANIAVVTEEVLRDSSPAAEAIVRDQLVAALRERLDLDFVDPDKAAVSGVSPASISYGVAPVVASGTDADAVRRDVQAVMATFIAANNAPTAGVWIMASTTALTLQMMLNPLGQPEFPGITMNGGSFFGMPVITSEYVPSDTNGAMVLLVNASDIYFADEGGFTVDMSREASLQMHDAPTTQDATSGTGTSLVSMWQTNCVAFRAERTLNWAKRRSSAVARLDRIRWAA